jgi:hypothetical protein
MLCSLPLIRIRACDGVYEHREFIHIQLAIVIRVRPSELHFQESKYLILRNCFGRRNRSHVILDCHENLRPQKGPLIVGKPRLRGFMEGHYNAAACRAPRHSSRIYSAGTDSLRFLLRLRPGHYIPVVALATVLRANGWRPLDAYRRLRRLREAIEFAAAESATASPPARRIKSRPSRISPEVWGVAPE